MIKNIFGTAGMRASAGTYPLDKETVLKFGHALADFIIKKHGPKAKILIAGDTRSSTNLIKAQLKAGLLERSVLVYDAQVLPTPIVHYLVHQLKSYDFGIIITASHNPYTDNGIKLIERNKGYLSTEEEIEISQAVVADLHQPINYQVTGQEHHVKTAGNTYIQKILDYFSNQKFDGLSVVIDCANGAVAQIAPTIFHKLGLKVTAINTFADGSNINRNCGATYPELLQQMVQKYKANFGFAFDGDGDRVVAITANGEIKDGDAIIAFLATNPSYNACPNIGGTLISNFGLELWLKKSQKLLIRSAVGEINLLKTMQLHNCQIGSEPSGHIILRDFANHSDGLFVALKILQTAVLTNNSTMQTFIPTPQLSHQIAIKTKKDLTKAPIADTLNKYQELLKPGRLVARYSGTEDLLRIVLEGEDANYLATLSQQLCQELTPLLDI